MCDIKGCYRIPYAEAYIINKHKWLYLCKKHYTLLYKKHKDKYAWYELTLKERIKAIFDSLIWYIRGM
jgi:hypothetical protein